MLVVAGLVCSVWCFLTQQPTWLCTATVSFTLFFIASIFEKKR